MFQDKPGFGAIDYSNEDNMMMTGVEVVVRDELYKSTYSDYDFLSWPERVSDGFNTEN